MKGDESRDKNKKNKRHVEENIEKNSSEGNKLEDEMITTNLEKTDKLDEKKENEVGKIIRKVVNSSENILNYADNIVKMIDNIKNDAQKTLDMKNNDNDKETTINNDNNNEKKKETYDSVSQNITDILKKFLMSTEKSSEDDDIDDDEEDEDSNLFEWTKEKLVEHDKNPWDRSKNKNDFADDYIIPVRTFRKIADVNHSFLTVTLPTIGISLFLLTFCFFNLRSFHLRRWTKSYAG
ncbi:conserved hypothetical protein [Pediculus humanus corporis]|uniref:Uncharacterized protein n=1 Tax=Pediculus humanus subsp. corporis TaxID=121224 RepID=E0VT00_PEDHC|nr:uncharacterized protein Phum_PHUM424730 [Pediculus humanus corporis]EEB16506.1 conserved hypothetical protein [Pediculus humanus corporis]